jgi:hypothetical protein
MSNTLNNIAAVFAMGLFLAFVLGLFLAWPVMLLWNIALVPATTFLNPIGFFQAWGIMVLFNILFRTKVTTKKD